MTARSDGRVDKRAVGVSNIPVPGLGSILGFHGRKRKRRMRWFLYLISITGFMTGKAKITTTGLLL